MTAPECLARSKKQNLDADPLSGRRVTDLATDLNATAKPVVAKAIQAMFK